MYIPGKIEIIEQMLCNFKDIDVFDVYMGDNVDMGKKSIAFKLTFNDPTKTLTDVEVNTIFENVISEVEKAFNAELRNK